MFAFPAMFPAATFRAAAWPLLGIIASWMLWASGAVAANRTSAWVMLVFNAALFAWLAVRMHRLVLLETEDTTRTTSADTFTLAFRYLAALTAGAALKVLFLVLVLTLFSLVSAAIAWFGPVTTISAPMSPGPKPEIQRLINVMSVVGQLPVIYLLARCSTLLPALALGGDWSLRPAWRLTRGNGWRLVLVVFLLPWALSAVTDLAYWSTENKVLAALLAIARAVLLALGVIALSLAYRELTAAPAPPPTAPPA
jgi:hypothetical protein